MLPSAVLSHFFPPPSLSSPQPQGSTDTSSEEEPFASASMGVKETGERRTPALANPSLAGPCLVAVECSVYLIPWGSGEMGLWCLQNALKIKESSGGEHSVIHLVLPPFIRSSFYPIIAYHYTQFKYSNSLDKPWASMFLLQIQNKGITFNFRDK